MIHRGASNPEVKASKKSSYIFLITSILGAVFLLFLGSLFLKGGMQTPALVAVAESQDQNILHPDQLFDIRLVLEEETVTDVKQIAPRVTFVSFGRVPTPVSFTVSILDNSGGVVYTKTDEVVVETELSYPVSLADVHVPKGSYTITLDTKYDTTVEDHFEQKFTVYSPMVRGHGFLFAGFTAAFVAVGLVGIAFMHRSGRLKPRHILITSNASIAALTFLVILPFAGKLMFALGKSGTAHNASVVGVEISDVHSKIPVSMNLHERLHTIETVFNENMTTPRSFEDLSANMAREQSLLALYEIRNEDGGCHRMVSREQGSATTTCEQLQGKSRVFMREDGEIVARATSSVVDAQGEKYTLVADFSITDVVYNLAWLSEAGKTYLIYDDEGNVLAGNLQALNGDIVSCIRGQSGECRVNNRHITVTKVDFVLEPLYVIVVESY